MFSRLLSAASRLALGCLSAASRLLSAASRLPLGYSRLPLGCPSAASRQSLGYISAVSRLYLGCVSPAILKPTVLLCRRAHGTRRPASTRPVHSWRCEEAPFTGGGGKHEREEAAAAQSRVRGRLPKFTRGGDFNHDVSLTELLLWVGGVGGWGGGRGHWRPALLRAGVV